MRIRPSFRFRLVLMGVIYDYSLTNENKLLMKTLQLYVPGTSKKTLLRDGLSPKTHQRISCLEMPFSASSNSIRIHETTVDMSNRQAEQRHTSNADCKFGKQISGDRAKPTIGHLKWICPSCFRYFLKAARPSQTFSVVKSFSKM